jgi:oligosaccharide repeat unit polymerase
MLIGFEVFLLMGPLLLPQWAYDFYSDNERVFQTWLACALGLFCFMLGYRLHLPENIKTDLVRIKPSSFLYRKLDILKIFWFGTAFILGRVIFFEYWALQSGADSFFVSGIFANNASSDQIFLWGWWFSRLITLVGVLFLALVLVSPLSIKLVYRAVAILLLLLAFYSTIIEGNRGAFLDVVLSVSFIGLTQLLGPSQKNPQKNKILWVWLGLLVVIIVLGVFWQTLFRNYNVDVAVQNLNSGDVNLSTDSLAESGGDMLIYLDRILQEFGKVTPYTYGTSYIAPFVIIIPRNIWLNKPTGTADYLGNAGPTIVGELYANFSWIGIILGMVVFGYLLRLWYRFYLHHINSSFIQLIFAMSFPVVIYEVRGDFNTATNKVIYSALILSLVWKFITKKAEVATEASQDLATITSSRPLTASRVSAAGSALPHPTKYLIK